MTTTLIKKSSSLDSYSVLRSRVRQTLLLGQERIEQEKVRTYWHTGKLINDYLEPERGKDSYGKDVVTRLAKDLNIGETLLYRSMQFADRFPDPKIFAGRQISFLRWSHFRTLMTIPEEKIRYELAHEAFRREWTAEELEAKVRTIHSNKRGTKSKAQDTDLLTPKRGKAGVYQMIKDEASLAVDLGFTSYCKLPKASLKHFKAGNYCQWQGTAPPKKITGTPSDLFTYQAEVLKVVDGDTIWMKIWLADDLWLKEKLRLRGIDAPELDTAKGKEAKNFLERILKRQQSVLITTTKPDKYDRYLSDIFVQTKDGEIFLNNLLLERGLARLKTDYSFSDWNDLKV